MTPLLAEAAHRFAASRGSASGVGGRRVAVCGATGGSVIDRDARLPASAELRKRQLRRMVRARGWENAERRGFGALFADGDRCRSRRASAGPVSAGSDLDRTARRHPIGQDDDPRTDRRHSSRGARWPGLLSVNRSARRWLIMRLLTRPSPATGYERVPPSPHRILCNLAGADLRWTPVVRQPEPLLKV